MASPGAERETGKASAGTEDGKKTIVIYSPDLNFCFSLSIFFQDRFTVITTTNLGMLETSVKTYSAHLVILDAAPSENILERIGNLKSIDPALPIIMLYVYSTRDTRLDRMIRDRVDSVFYKPFEVAAISGRIEELLAA